ncbi:hypothetical protein O6H91_22G045000 [Diphasiastrum complanatum]|uniref:Uncharacterized protein n=2 Tax=Diphasiastrum complanatum TaxID=34168 RepID=A0ACC2AFB1_DIPCM|nr:hypothetical protein O6H91_22G045000 [Diphasiastrum complanatum]KAJ7516151.1 hypothetical protein O6H91_22G045000 [Diphasiastrum complanatum]
MRTRKANYPTPTDGITFSIRPRPQKRVWHTVTILSPRPSKLRRIARREGIHFCGFDHLPDDLLLSIILAVSSSADKPCDLVNTMLTCRRFCAAATHQQVLANASAAALAVRACNWSDGAHRFLKQCADAGNKEACYVLGMILFYCIRNRGGGASLMAKAAVASHSAALHSLAVIQFNGSGGIRKDKDLKAGVALCARAAALGHVDAMRELGHCLQDGYGVTKNIVEGRRLLLEANAREAAAAVAASPRRFVETTLKMSANCTAVRCLHHHLYYHQVLYKSNTVLCSAVEHPSFSSPTLDRLHVHRFVQGGGCSLLSDFGCNVPPPKLHVAHRFLVDWFMHNPPTGLKLCSHGNCGRPETRRHEFRRCSACGTVNYCSRACQALDWKIRHKQECTPTANWEDLEGNDVAEDAAERILNEIEDF